jgi:hypothetical protein
MSVGKSSALGLILNLEFYVSKKFMVYTGHLVLLG